MKVMRGCTFGDNVSFSGVIILGNSRFYDRQITAKDLSGRAAEFVERFSIGEGMEEYV